MGIKEITKKEKITKNELADRVKSAYSKASDYMADAVEVLTQEIIRIYDFLKDQNDWEVNHHYWSGSAYYEAVGYDDEPQENLDALRNMAELECDLLEQFGYTNEAKTERGFIRKGDEFRNKVN